MSPYREPSPPTLGCPRCNDTLVAVKHPRWEAMHCRRCAGVWLGAFGEADLEGMSRRLAARTAQLEGECDDLQNFAPSVECPSCRREMLRVRDAAAGVDVDICHEHGAWFDPGELKALARARKAEFEMKMEGLGSIGLVIAYIDGLLSPS